MSKAFTRESDDAPDVPLATPRVSTLPLGAKNYLTQDGAHRMREELARLTQVEQTKITFDEGALKQERALLNPRIARLQEALASATIVASPALKDVVHFGATVAVLDRSGSETAYRIVGADETDVDRGWVSWQSPIARALFKARLGDRVRFKFPSGEEDLEIVKITYEPG